MEENTRKRNGNYKDLNLYKKGNELVVEVYRVTRKYPKDEMFGLISQMRRCAVSVVANIVEGYARKTQKDKLHFCYISRGSLAELEYYIDLSLSLLYIEEEEHARLASLSFEVSKLLQGYIKFLSK